MSKHKEVIKEELQWDEKTNKVNLVTIFSNGLLLSQPLTPEQASEIQARQGY